VTAVSGSVVPLTEASASPDDAELISLAERFDQANSRYQLAFKRADDLYWVADEAYPALPDILRGRVKDSKLGIPGYRPLGAAYDPADLNALRNLRFAAPETQSRVDELVAGFDQWEAAKAQIEADTGYADAARQEEELAAEVDAVGRTVLSTPATTIHGLAAKARIAAAIDPAMAAGPLEDMDWDDVFLASLLRDVQALAQHLGSGNA
jgi:hypothetical protein